MATELMEQKMTYTVAGEKVELTPNIVRQYLVSGNPETVTMQELVMFMNLCRYNGLNPWLKEAYCIKYGSSPATMVVGKEAYLKRAEANEAYDGSEAGIILITKSGIEKRVGTFRLKEEEIVGGWAQVWRKDRSHPVTVEVSFEEYAGRTKDGQLNSQWRTKPATMIRKVALVQALREAFPGDLSGMNTEEEIDSKQNEIFVQSEVVKDNLPEQSAPAPKQTRKAAAKAAPRPVTPEEEIETVDVEEMPFA